MLVVVGAYGRQRLGCVLGVNYFNCLVWVWLFLLSVVGFGLCGFWLFWCLDVFVVWTLFADGC